jgi:hypothetical protein
VCKFADGLHTRANSDVPSIAPQSIEDQLTETISLSEQLLDEWNHRLKNNLQILIRLLESGYRKARSSEAREVLSDAIRRIGAIETAQRAYYCARGCTDVNVQDLVCAICANGAHAGGVQDPACNGELLVHQPYADRHALLADRGSRCLSKDARVNGPEQLPVPAGGANATKSFKAALRAGLSEHRS